MFDIGFYEILMIAIVGLVLIGPERLPETVRTISLYIGRLKRSLRETRREIENQLGADEIRRELHNEEVMKNLEKLRNDVNDGVEHNLALDDDLYSDHDSNNDIDPGEPWVAPESKSSTKSTTPESTAAKNNPTPETDENKPV